MAEKTYSLIDPEGTDKVGKQVFEVLGKIIADKIALGLHERWLRNHQLRRNLHWKAKSPSGVPLVSANMIYTHIQRTTNTLTDNDPTFNVAAIGKIEEMQKEQLSDLQRTTEHWWRDQEQQDVFESSVINGELYGIAIEKVLFNPDIEYRLGEAETIPIDPFHFGWYPVKMAFIRDLQKCECVLHFYPTSVRQLKAKYPKKAKEIKPDEEILDDLKDDERREIVGEGGAGSGSVMTSIASTIRELLNFVSGTGSTEDDEETVLCEMWLRDKTIVTEETDDPETGKKISETKPKYTGEIRYILVCSGGVVLEDKDNPNINPNLPEEQTINTYLYDKFPFSGANSIKDTSNAWGFSDCEQGEPLNMELNKALSQFVVEKDRSARKKLINPMDTGVPDEHFTNYVGIVKPTSAQTAAGIRWLETPPAGIDYEKAMALFKDFFFLVMGSFELDQAQVKGRDVIAYKAIAALMERAATMMRGKIRSYSRLIRDRGRMYLSHVMNFYTEERWITYKDEDGNESSKPIVGSSMIMPAKLTVVSGSTMPISRVQQREEALALFTQRAIDQQELLDKLDWSNRSEVVKRMMAGPLGQVFEKLMTAQVPEPVMEYLKAVAEMDPKDLKKELEKGTFPPFMAFAQKMMQEMGGQEQQGPAPEEMAALKEIESKIAVNMAKVEQTKAEAAHTMAEAELTREKAVTERVTQTVKLAGVEYDDATIKMQRAKLVNQMEGEEKDRQHEGIKAGLDMLSKKASEERNLKAGRESEARAGKRDMIKSGLNFAAAKHKSETAARTATEKFDKAGRAGFNEKGLKSNNIKE
ncbi:MAG: hypothetical protein ABIJ57_09525 [Pseudomonadota bacterium]|uniref:Portal protein n=1 Tax=viral metagenome TaxID=1070528 RepID=A0A6M3J670_9ZZZZ